MTRFPALQAGLYVALVACIRIDHQAIASAECDAMKNVASWAEWKTTLGCEFDPPPQSCHLDLRCDGAPCVVDCEGVVASGAMEDGRFTHFRVIELNRTRGHEGSFNAGLRIFRKTALTECAQQTEVQTCGTRRLFTEKETLCCIEADFTSGQVTSARLDDDASGCPNRLGPRADGGIHVSHSLVPKECAP